MDLEWRLKQYSEGKDKKEIEKNLRTSSEFWSQPCMNQVFKVIYLKDMKKEVKKKSECTIAEKKIMKENTIVIWKLTRQVSLSQHGPVPQSANSVRVQSAGLQHFLNPLQC